MSQEKVQTPLLDLEEALKGLEAPEHLKTALRRVLSDDVWDLAVVPEADLATIDTVAKNRVLYVLAILKAINFLKLPGATFDAREAQAKVALAYIRHAEAQNLAGLQIGRTKSDSALESEIDTLRQQMDRLVEHKAKIQGKNGQKAVH